MSNYIAEGALSDVYMAADAIYPATVWARQHRTRTPLGPRCQNPCTLQIPASRSQSPNTPRDILLHRHPRHRSADTYPEHRHKLRTQTLFSVTNQRPAATIRTEKRRVGQEGDSTWRSRLAPE